MHSDFNCAIPTECGRKRPPLITPVLAALFGVALSVHGTVLVDDTWADGSRNEQNLPAESAWHASNASSLTASPGSLLGQNITSSRLWLTYFTPFGSPAELAIGDTLKATLVFTPANITSAPSTTRGLRIGLYNFSAPGAARQVTDSFSTTGIGTNVAGYMLNMNFAQTFTVDSPMQIMERTDTASLNLMGSSSQYTPLGSGPAGVLNNAAFSSGTQYTFEFAVARTAADAVSIVAAFSGGSLNVSHMVTDSAGSTFSFDGFAIRVNNQNDAAQLFDFAELKIEVLPAGSGAPSITTHPQSTAVAAGQTTSFSVVADGSPPLRYQWYHNTNSLLANATNAMLTLTNVQAAQAGVYSVIVTNGSGSVTSAFAMLTVTNLVGPPLTIDVPGGTVTVTFEGDPAYEYEVQRSTNLADWVILMTTNPPQAGLIQIVDDFDDLGGAPPEAYYQLRVITLAPVAPAISTQPQNQTVIENQNATFSVTATGTTLLRYQWYFNTNTPLAGATNAMLTLTNVQSNQAGSYSVVVTNSAGSATSSNAHLTILVPPSITSQPSDQTVLPGEDATFTVAATGTAPLRYQWYFNTNTALANATNASLTINNVQTNDGGGYSVVVTNVAGSVTSVVAALAVNTSVPIGFATVNGGTTGGQGGPTVTVTNLSGFISAVTQEGARIVRVVGTITLGGNVRPGSDKTIVGVGSDATLIGDLNIYQATNVIVQNLHFTNPSGVGDEDGVTIEESSNVWIDHCTFFDCSDGELDVTHGSDFVTVSWCKFYYTVQTGHNFVTLVGHSDNNADEDTGKLHVTFHHNWWSTLCHERMPRVRFGRVHVFNNYANCSGNNNCVRASIESEVLVENNYYDAIDTPYEKFDPPGLIRAMGNSTPNCTGVQSFSDTVFAPPYAYTLDPAGDVPAAVTNFAGAGILNF